MSTQPNPIPAYPFGADNATPAASRVPRPLYWSIRRELWEYRSIYLAPLIVAGVTVLGYLVASLGRALTTSNLALRRAVLEEPYDFASGVIMATTFVVGVFYCLDALHGERQDRSILFWKSLPVSDRTTVLAKACIAFVVLPLLTFVIAVATGWIMLLVGSAVLMGSGLNVSTLWAQTFHNWMGLFHHLFMVHVLWYSPIYSWMLLVSGWARRLVFLWAGLPVLAVAAFEKVVFNTGHFVAFLGYRITGPEQFSSRDILELWIGMFVAAIFLAAAVRLRRQQGPI
jgi:ABC-2 type transport system permease protein